MTPTRQLSKALMVILLMLAPFAISAQASPTVQPSADAARISGTPGLLNQDIFPVIFNGIDDRNIQPRNEIWLRPGTYKINVMIDAAFTRPPGPGGRKLRSENIPNVIELELEAGKTYQVRARYNRNNREMPYSIIVHQVSDHD